MFSFRSERKPQAAASFLKPAGAVQASVGNWNHSTRTAGQEASESMVYPPRERRDNFFAAIDTPYACMAILVVGAASSRSSLSTTMQSTPPCSRNCCRVALQNNQTEPPFRMPPAAPRPEIRPRTPDLIASRRVIMHRQDWLRTVP